MSVYLCSPWADVVQAAIALVGTFLMIYSLQTIQERGGVFDTTTPHPSSPRVWYGFGILVVAALLPLAQVLIGPCSLSP